MFTPGDIVYFKKARKSTKRSALEGTFKGNAVGVLLGEIPPFGQDVRVEHVLPLLGRLGFLTFDDVGEFLGAEAGTEVLKKYEAKYYGMKKDEKQQELPITVPPELPKAPSNIVGIDGKPL